jgi:ubiquinone/menaquinone biosynthesis C-methylase UbiE
VTEDVARGVPWTADRRDEVTRLFDSLAPGWSARFTAEEARVPVLDAFARGGLPGGGRCVEVGSGTGKVTPALAGSLDPVIALDVSWEMLVRAPADPGIRVRGDGAALPFPDASIDVVALVNAFLFPDEVDRVLCDHGAVLWVNTLADQTPIHLPPASVLEFLPGSWDGVTAPAGWGEWTVARRAPRSGC